MTYQQMRVLVACLARYDGRLRMLAAQSAALDAVGRLPARPRAADVAVRVPARSEQRRAGTPERPLAELRAQPEPHGARRTWSHVLWALTVLCHNASTARTRVGRGAVR